MVTFHPVTLEADSAEQQTISLCNAMEKCNSFFYLITMANADAGGDAVNRILQAFADTHENVKIVSSLGMKRYLSSVKYAQFVLGNSSSGIIEAPVLGTPTVNIGDRQKGRLMADTIVQCNPKTEEIVRAIQTAAVMEHQPTRMYGEGNTSSTILRHIKEFLLTEKIDLKKKFYDLKGEFCEN